MRRTVKLPYLAILFALAACGHSAEPNFYTLATVEGPTALSIKDTIKVAQPDLPQFLDRPDFVSQSDRYQININETANWADPLATQFERILTDDLQQRLPMAMIKNDSDTNDSNTWMPRYVIETKIQQFNPAMQGQIILQASLSLTDVVAPTKSKYVPLTLILQNGSDDPKMIAKALSILIGEYADHIALNLLKSPHT